MDTTVVILIIVLLFVLGIFAVTQISSGSGTTGKAIGSSYAGQQYSGGGCGI